MTSLSIHWPEWPEFTLSTLLDLVAIFFIALLINRFLRVLTKLIVKPAATQSRAAQVRANSKRVRSRACFCGSGSKVVGSWRC